VRPRTPPVPSLFPRRHVHQHQQQAPGGAVRTASRSLGASCAVPSPHRPPGLVALADRAVGFQKRSRRDHDSHLLAAALRRSRSEQVCATIAKRKGKGSRSASCTQLYILLVFAFRDMFPICEDAIMPLCLLCKLSFFVPVSFM